MAIVEARTEQDDASTPETVARVAYLVSGFPKLTETFVLYEILAMRQLGFEVELFPLRRERTQIMHEEAQAVSRISPLYAVTPVVAPLLGTPLLSDDQTVGLRHDSSNAPARQLRQPAVSGRRNRVFPQSRTAGVAAEATGSPALACPLCQPSGCGVVRSQSPYRNPVQLHCTRLRFASRSPHAA